MTDIVEFETDLQMQYELTHDARFGTPTGYKWMTKTSVDLTWVAGAKTHSDLTTSIILSGSDRWFIINCPYSRFMEMWMAARARRQP